MTGLQGIVDAGANVVHASSRSDVDGERKQALDEALLDNGLFGELGLLIEQGDDDRARSVALLHARILLRCSGMWSLSM